MEDDVFMWWGRRARRQGNRAVVAQAERKALIGRRLEVVGPRGAGGLQVEGLEEKNKTRKLLCEQYSVQNIYIKVSSEINAPENYYSQHHWGIKSSIHLHTGLST